MTFKSQSVCFLPWRPPGVQCQQYCNRPSFLGTELGSVFLRLCLLQNVHQEESGHS